MENKITLTGSIIAISFALTTNAMAALGLPTTEAECLKTYDMGIPDVSGIDPQLACENSLKMPEVGDKCKAVYEKIRSVYNKAETRLKGHCASAHELADFDKACGANMSSANCTQQSNNLQTKALQFVQEHRANVKELMTELENAKNVGIEGAEKIVENINDLNSVSPMVRNEGSQAAAEAGASTTNQALNEVHSGQKAGELLQIIEKVRNPSSISGGDVGQVESLPAFEVLQGAQIAKDMKQDLTEFDRKLAQQESDLTRAKSTTADNTARHQSITEGGTKDGQTPQTVASSNPGAQNWGAAAAGAGAVASGFAGGGGGSSGYPGESFEYVNAASNSGSKILTGTNSGKANAVIAGASNSVESKKLAEAAAVKSGTAASKMDGSAASALREKLRMQMSAAGGSEADAVAASNAKAGILGADGKPKKGVAPFPGFNGGNLSPEELNMLTGSTKLSSQSGFSLQGSETDATVNALVKDFEGQLDAEGRGIASESQGNMDDIGSEDSANLFSRMKGVFDRCLKKGCVSASRGSS